MNATQENKVSMYYKVDLFLTNHVSEIAGLVPAITSISNTFSNHLNNLQNYEQEASEDITGYAVQKQLNRTIMRDKAMMVSGGYVAYLLVNGNRTVAEKYNFTKSELDAMRDTEILYKMQTLAEAVGPISPATLNPYGVTSDLIHTVGGGESSTKFSTTLAPSGVGDIVLFQNTSLNPIDIELTLLE